MLLSFITRMFFDKKQSNTYASWLKALSHSKVALEAAMCWQYELVFVGKAITRISITTRPGKLSRWRC